MCQNTDFDGTFSSQSGSFKKISHYVMKPLLYVLVMSSIWSSIRLLYARRQQIVCWNKRALANLSQPYMPQSCMWLGIVPVDNE